MCPTYVAELAPAAIRGNITGLFQVCVVTGVGKSSSAARGSVCDVRDVDNLFFVPTALSYWINYGCTFMGPVTNAWRIPVAMQVSQDEGGH